MRGKLESAAAPPPRVSPLDRVAHLLRWNGLAAMVEGDVVVIHGALVPTDGEVDAISHVLGRVLLRSGDREIRLGGERAKVRSVVPV